MRSYGTRVERILLKNDSKQISVWNWVQDKFAETNIISLFYALSVRYLKKIDFRHALIISIANCRFVLQPTSSWNTLKHELLSTLMPIFLGNHPNSGVVLNYAWHCQVRHNTYIQASRASHFLLMCPAYLTSYICPRKIENKNDPWSISWNFEWTRNPRFAA